MTPTRETIRKLVQSAELTRSRFASGDAPATLRLPALETLACLRELRLDEALQGLRSTGLAATLAQLGQILLTSDGAAGPPGLLQNLARVCMKLRDGDEGPGMRLRYQSCVTQLHAWSLQVSEPECEPDFVLDLEPAPPRAKPVEIPQPPSSFLQQLFETCEDPPEGEFWNDNSLGLAH